MARILLIDDDEDLRAVMRHDLESAGHQVFLAAHGGEGFEMQQRHEADLVVVDLLMPEKEGIETIYELKQAYPGVKIIAISGGGRAINTADYLSMAADIGADTALQKPFEGAALLQSVSQLLAPADAHP